MVEKQGDHLRDKNSLDCLKTGLCVANKDIISLPFDTFERQREEKVTIKS